jgi:hypothetical protein
MWAHCESESVRRQVASLGENEVDRRFKQFDARRCEIALKSDALWSMEEQCKPIASPAATAS